MRYLIRYVLKDPTKPERWVHLREADSWARACVLADSRCVKDFDACWGIWKQVQLIASRHGRIYETKELLDE